MKIELIFSSVAGVKSALVNGVETIRNVYEKVKKNDETTNTECIEMYKLRRVYKIFDACQISYLNRDYVLAETLGIRNFNKFDDYYTLGTVFIRALCDKLLKSDIKDKTIYNYVSDYNRFFTEIHAMDIRKMNMKFLRKYTYKLFFVDFHNKVAYKNYKSLVNMIFDYATKKGIIEEDIARNLEPYSFFKQIHLRTVAKALKELYEVS